MKRVRIDEVFCKECFMWYHWSELHSDADNRRKFPTAIMDWLYDPKGHVVGIMADDPRTPVGDQINESLERIRRREY